MEYKLNEVRAGEFEVVRSMPVVVGTFADPEIARKFMLFLMEEEIDAQRDLEAAAANSDAEPIDAGPAAPPPEPEANAAPEEQVHRAPYAPVTKMSDEKPTVDPASFETSDEPWTEDELETAFHMLSKGETLKVVAARHGKSWTKLRARWATFKKAQNQKGAAVSSALVPVSEPRKTPVEKVTAAVADLAAQDKCKICQRHFTPTVDNLDLCARCHHGA